MVRLTRRYAFFASHRLHSPRLTDAENAAVYGKCNNPEGHGHNYEIELVVRGPVDPVTGRVASLDALDALARREILNPLGYRNLNVEVPAFRELVPTTENLAREVDARLRAAWPAVFGEPGVFSETGPQLELVRIRETERNICEVWQS